MHRYFVVCMIAVALSGCASTGPRDSIRHAILDDVAVGTPLDSGYRVVAVDGKPVERARDAIHTVVPFAIVAPGYHTLSLEPRGGNALEATTVPLPSRPENATGSSWKTVRSRSPTTPIDMTVIA